MLKLPPLSRDIRLVVAHDWEQIVGKPIHWAPLPRKPCVADLLQTYAATKRQGGAHGQAWRDFAGCLISYFDAALPRLLLYRQERQQYDLRARGRGAPSRLYGAEHLVRLIIKLPKLLAQTNLTKGEIPRLKRKLEDLLKYLRQNRARLPPRPTSSARRSSRSPPAPPSAGAAPPSRPAAPADAPAYPSPAFEAAATEAARRMHPTTTGVTRPVGSAGRHGPSRAPARPGVALCA